MYSLIFFGTCLLACRPADDTGVTINWDGKRATSLTISSRLIGEIDADSLAQLLTVRLAGQSIGMAGTYKQTPTGVRFDPLIPFTRDRRYTIWLRNKPLSEVAIPALDGGDKPALLAIYPSADSLPDNLLKVYLHFSRPMRESQSARYVALLSATGDTLRDVFLDLQPELWNADRTILTLWLDPGRIKRDLQPNKRLGVPLQIGHQYQLVISPDWPDALGAKLGQRGLKAFQVIRRDSLSPNPARWSVRLPKAGTLAPVTVAFSESLDHYLLTETMHIFLDDGSAVPGAWHIGQNEAQSQFTPKTNWTAGRYRLRVENRLEDLAGNNLSRPFDRDITRTKRPDDGKTYKEVTFEVRD